MYPRKLMSSTNLKDAKQECEDKAACYMFYDVCGGGTEFRYCTYRSPQRTAESCGSILYIKKNKGNLYVINMSQSCQHYIFLRIYVF